MFQVAEKVKQGGSVPRAWQWPLLFARSVIARHLAALLEPIKLILLKLFPSGSTLVFITLLLPCV